jgi:DNA processing protein
MTDLIELFSFSQIIKKLQLYKNHRDEIHQIYLQLGKSGALNVDNLRQVCREKLSHLQGFLPGMHPGFFSHEFDQHQDEFKKIRAENRQLAQQGVQFAVYGTNLFPSHCYLMGDPPLTLSFQGSPVWLMEKSIAVVGSREPSQDSLKWLEKELAEFCRIEKSLIVSGGARGIDQKAHAIALRNNCPTIIVLPSGLGQIYPASLKNWLEPVLAGGGCVLSEYDYSQKMHKYLFHHRNRLIAALGLVTLLVEAKRKSGTLITAQQAAQLGRPVGVVPGHPYDPHFAGCLDLLSEGATIIRDAQDLSIFLKAEFHSKGEFLPHMG